MLGSMQRRGQVVVECGGRGRWSWMFALLCAAGVLAVAASAPAGTQVARPRVSAVALGPSSAGRSAASVASWPQFRYSPEQRGYNPLGSNLDSASVHRLTLAWTADTGGVIFATPVVANGVVYVGSGDGSMSAFDAATGALRWKVALVGAVGQGGSAAVVNGVVYTVTRRGWLYALNAATGEVIWSDGQVNSPFAAGVSAPTVTDGAVYINIDRGIGGTGGDEHVEAYNAATGALRWRSSDNSDASDASPAVVNGTVYIDGNSPGSVYAFDATNGALRWVTSVPCVDESSPAVANGTVYVGSGALVPGFCGGVSALDAATGRLVWSTRVSGGVQSSPAVPGNAELVFVNDGDGAVDALDAATGTVRWTVSTGEPPPFTDLVPSAAVANGVVFTAREPLDSSGGSSGALDAFNEFTGGHEFKYAAGGRGFESSPVVVNTHVYIGGVDGKLYAFKLP